MVMSCLCLHRISALDWGEIHRVGADVSKRNNARSSGATVRHVPADALVCDLSSRLGSKELAPSSIGADVLRMFGRVFFAQKPLNPASICQF